MTRLLKPAASRRTILDYSTLQKSAAASARNMVQRAMRRRGQSYCVVTIQSGSTLCGNGEVVKRLRVPSAALMAKAEMFVVPTLATYRNVLLTSTVKNTGCGVPVVTSV